MKVFLTGGSGFIGTHLRLFLETKGIDVVYFDKREPKIISKSKYIKGDIRDYNKLLESMAECSVVFHLAAEWDDFIEDSNLYYDVNVNGTQQVINAAKALSINKIINYSSVSVYGEFEGECEENSTPLKPVNHYGKSKLQAETLFDEWFEVDNTISIIHLRPSVVFGVNNYGNIYRLINQIASGKYFHISKGTSKKSITYVENLVEATLFLYNNMKPGIEVYNYSDEPHHSSIQISNTIAKALGKKEPLTLPYWIALVVAIPFDFLIWMTKKNFPISTMRVRKYCTQTLNNSKKIIDLGFKPKYSSKEGLNITVKWYLTK